MIFISNEEDLVFSKPVVLYFCSSWMPYHKKMIIMIKKMEEEFPDFTYFAINVDQFKQLCKRFSVTEIPTVIIFTESKEQKRITGLPMTSAFRAAFIDICNNMKPNKLEKKLEE